MARARQGLVRFSAGGMAGPDSIALLQLSRDGGAWNNFYRRDGRGVLIALARKTVRLSLDALDADGLRAASLYCQHGGVDDRRTRAAALAAFWIYAHGQRNFSARVPGDCLLPADWRHWHVNWPG